MKDKLTKEINYDPDYRPVPKTKVQTIFDSEDVIDLNSLNLSQLVGNLKEHINKKPSMFLWLRRRNNEKIQLESEKIDLLSDNILRLVNLGREVSNLHAEAVLSAEILENLVSGKRLEFEHNLDIQVKKHLLEVHDLDHKMKLKDLEAKAKEVDIEKILEEIATAKMIREEISNLPPKEKAYVLGKLINKNKDTDETDYFDKDHKDRMQAEKLEQEEDKTDSLKVDKDFKIDKWEQVKKQRGKQ